MKLLGFGVGMIVAGAAYGQSSPADGDALRQLVTEVKQLRLDVEAVMAASQRVQIALHAFDAQNAIVVRSRQRVEDVRDRCTAAEAQQQRLTAEIQRVETTASVNTASAPENKQLQLELTDLKRRLEEQTADARNCRASEAEAAAQLRSDEAKLAEVESRIEQLVQSLDRPSGK
jgi:regulator of replication initiation timing